MKKFYLLAAIAVLGFVNVGLAQGTYTATTTGNWSSGGTWDINGAPSPQCTDCTITINSGVTVTLNTDILLKGSSQMTVRTGASIKITLSSNVAPNPAAPIPVSGYHRIDIVYNDPVKVFVEAGATIDASTTGLYDGVFLYVPIGTPNNSSYAPITRLGASNIFFPTPDPTIITGPATLSSNGTLPIFLTSFEAALNNDVVNLTWTTSAEINSDHFGVEKSTDASHWNTIGTVAAAGFSSIPINYSFSDESPASGVSYYRLQMIDKDGKYKYSPFKVVNGGIVKGMSVFPNPVNNYVNVTFGNDIKTGLTLRLLNQFGQVLHQRKLADAAGTTISIPVSNYPQGSYILQVTGEDGSKQTRKLLISR